MSAVQVGHVVTGREDGPVVVLSNSLGSTYHMWDAQLAALEKRFRVVRYDTRGHGVSPVPDGPYSIDDLADDLVDLLDRLGIGRAHLVGLSLGGMTAMRVGARNAERVDRLALLCTGAQWPPRLSLDRPRRDGARRRQRRYRQGGRRALVHFRVPRGPSRRQGGPRGGRSVMSADSGSGMVIGMLPKRSSIAASLVSMSSTVIRLILASRWA